MSDLNDVMKAIDVEGSGLFDKPFVESVMDAIIDHDEFDYSLLIEKDQGMTELLNEVTYSEKKVFNYFCQVSLDFSVLEAQRRVRTLLWLSTDESEHLIERLDIIEPRLIWLVRECDYFVPALLEIGALYVRWA